MQSTSSDQLLKSRVIHAIVDDEEYPEEIYQCVNFDLKEHPPGPGGTKIYRAYAKTYRLTEVLECLKLLEEAGLVTAREVAGYDPCCGLTSRLYSLTRRGEQFWRDVVKTQVDSLYK